MQVHRCTCVSGAPYLYIQGGAHKYPVFLDIKDLSHCYMSCAYTVTVRGYGVIPYVDLAHVMTV